MEKLTDIYLYSDRENQAGPTGNIKTLTSFSVIALFILLLACINFINLSTARAAERAKEVGIKKVNGVTRQQLTAQFFYRIVSDDGHSAGHAVSLSCCYCLCSIHLRAKVLHLIVQPQASRRYNSYTGRCCLLSGGYPAFILSSFNPIAALKGNLKASGWSVGIRKGW